MTNHKSHQYSRRDLLKLSGSALAATTLAGCLNTTDTNSGNTTTTSPPTDTPTDTRTTSSSSTNTEHSTPTPTDSGEFTTATRQNAQTVGAQLRKSTIKVTTKNSGGAGWVLNTTEGLIVTNSHVVKNSDTATITTYDDTTHTATVFNHTPNHIPDVALLQLTPDSRESFSAPELTIGNDTTLDENTPLVQVGHPARVGSWVVALGRYLEHEPAPGWFESTLPSQPGNSGGPVVTLDGTLVGMTSGSTTNDGRDRPSKHTETPPELYTDYPEPERVTTHVPATEITNLVTTWTN